MPSDVTFLVINEVLDNLTNKDFGVTSLCEIAFLSQSQFARKLKSMTGKTPIDFIRTIRLECALEYLQDGESVSEVGYKVGFDDPVYFSKVFKKHFGFAPSHYLKRSINDSGIN